MRKTQLLCLEDLDPWNQLHFPHPSCPVPILNALCGYYCFSFPCFWMSRSLHSKLRLGSGSSSSLTDLSQTKSPAGGGGEKGGTAGGLAEECGKDKGTQQRRAGANATWNRSACESVTCVFTICLKWDPRWFTWWMWRYVDFFWPPRCPHSSSPACVYTHMYTLVCACTFFTGNVMVE